MQALNDSKDDNLGIGHSILATIQEVFDLNVVESTTPLLRTRSVCDVNIDGSAYDETDKDIVGETMDGRHMQDDEERDNGAAQGQDEQWMQDSTNGQISM